MFKETAPTTRPNISWMNTSISLGELVGVEEGGLNETMFD